MTSPPTTPHAGHQLTGLTRLIDPETRVGYLACLTCSALLRPLRRCAQPTREGPICRVFVRDDLGHERCWSHGIWRGHAALGGRMTDDVREADRLVREILATVARIRTVELADATLDGVRAQLLDQLDDERDPAAAAVLRRVLGRLHDATETGGTRQ